MPAGAYRPAEAAKQVGIAGNTLRVYAARFAPLLSANAAREGSDTRHRQYSTEDIAVLARARHMLAEGATYEQALVSLSAGARAAPTSLTPAASESAVSLAAMQEALLAWRALAEDRSAEVSALRARVELLEQQLVRLSVGERADTRVHTETEGRPARAAESLARANDAAPSGAPGRPTADTHTLADGGSASGDPGARPHWWSRVFPGDAADDRSHRGNG